jgi:hypothetical protein
LDNAGATQLHTDKTGRAGDYSVENGKGDK